MNIKKTVIGVAAAAILTLSGSLYAVDYATVDGKKITDQDLKFILHSLGGVDFTKLPKDRQKKIIDQAIERRLLTNKAIKDGIEKDEIYKKTLESIKRDLALEIWMKKQYANVNATEKEVKDYYKKNADKFKRPEMVKARHILVKTEKEANEIIKDLKKAGSGKKLEDKFIALAKKKSVGPSGKNGGELGWFDKKQMVKEFSKAAFSLKKGDFTKKPVKTQFGYHIIMVEDKKPAGKIEFDKVENSIISQIKLEKFKSNVQKMAKELRNKAKIKYLTK